MIRILSKPKLFLSVRTKPKLFSSALSLDDEDRNKQKVICLRFHWVVENKRDVAKQFLILDLSFNLCYLTFELGKFLEEIREQRTSSFYGCFSF